MEIEARASPDVDVLARVTEALERRFGSGPIEGRMSAFVFTAEAPLQS
jgi:hypothetical protein